MKKPVTLIIMDGYGINDGTIGNAIAAANTPNLDMLFAKYPHTTIAASGRDVGLPDGQMGNSEVGHTNIGAGRIVYQELTRITKSIEDGDFFENSALLGAMDNCIENGSALHLMGLLSDGGVHSHNTHLYAIAELAKRRGVSRLYVHCFLDGRDVSPTSGEGFVRELAAKLDEIGVGSIATVMGRYYAMDRDNRWERVERGYNAMAVGKGNVFHDAAEAVSASYKNGVTDEFVEPCVRESFGGINENDSIIFYNFRPDRAREITRAFVDENFNGFEREKINVFYVCMTQYDASMPNVEIAFRPESLDDTFGEYISKAGLKQLRIAETEKYAHVTFFFNGGVEKVYPGEERSLIPSPKVATYDLQPEMSAFEVGDEVVKRIESCRYDVIILNFANCDMVGHTGIFEAAVRAVEAVDENVGRVVRAMEQAGGVTIITADHGNAEKMLDADNSVFTAHTINKVPLILVGMDRKLKEGRLADIAPTMLEILGLDKPNSMKGESLLI